MEFRFAHIALHLPLVVAVVGTGFQWEATEVSRAVRGCCNLKSLLKAHHDSSTLCAVCQGNNIGSLERANYK